MNWGIIGCAQIAQRSVMPAILSIAENRLIAVSSRHQQTADALAAQFNCLGIEGYDQLLQRTDIDAVYIPLPTGIHFEWVMNALQAGKHVLVEKSAFCSIKEAEEAVTLAREKELIIVENFQFQHHSQHAFVKDLLANHEIGELRAFKSSFGFPPFGQDDNIRYKKELGGGALLDAGAYTLKATSFILGEGFRVKAAQLVDHKGYGVDWYGGAFLANPDKQIFSEVAFGFDNYYQCNYEIWGSKGKITSTRAFTAKADYHPVVILEKNGKAEEIVLDTDDHFRNILLYFNQIVLRKEDDKEFNNILVQANLVEQLRKAAQSLDGPA